MLNLADLKTTEQLGWKVHDSFLTLKEAWGYLLFFKNQGYQAVKIVEHADSFFTIQVLITKGANR